MKHYAIVELDITDSGWVAEYARNVTRMVEQRGGRYLTRTATVERIEGQRNVPQIVVILEWPSKEAAVEFYQSEEYRPYRQSRLEGAQNEFILVPGEDIANLARMES
ncbi:MAG TPA: DUF1330 domain-containing protein [Terriglobales bacterium]|nr:DUF1330 domain-containing protein [Terriglobales bacterium]